jgi:amino acid transporter
LLIAVAISYRQTIPAYPGGGGSFTVAKENLGPLAGLVAASALCVDYVLNVAVAISAGVGALVSAAPALLPYTLPLCLAILAFMTIVNVRGVRSAGLLFMFPTYLFIGCLGLAIIIGIAKTILAHGHPVPVISPPKLPGSTAAVSLWLLMRAFASGCTALTGVEAVSNAVPIFRKPRTILARRTLTIIFTTLGLLVAGVAFLSHSYGITATPPGQAGYQSILSQLISAVTGRGAFYYVSIAAILMVLTLSANTSFMDFPRVCRLLALDEYLPAEFAHRGRRLVYTEGVYVLAVLSGLVLIMYGGITDRLIPLFAIGAFLAFTFSQAGMVVHWHRSKEPGATRSLVFNGLGAAATATALIIIVISKFMEGGWLVIIVMPAILLGFLYIRRYHEKIEHAVQENEPLDTTRLSQPVIVIPLKRLDRVAQKALAFALTLSPEIHAVQILGEEMNIEDLSKHWPELVERPARKAGCKPPQLTVIRSPYREFFGPLLDYIRKLAAEDKDRYIAIIVPELVERRWYNFLLRHRATVLKGLLILHGGPQIVIIDAPWYLSKGRSFR